MPPRRFTCSGGPLGSRVRVVFPERVFQPASGPDGRLEAPVPRLLHGARHVVARVVRGLRLPPGRAGGPVPLRGSVLQKVGRGFVGRGAGLGVRRPAVASLERGGFLEACACASKTGRQRVGSAPRTGGRRGGVRAAVRWAWGARNRWGRRGKGRGGGGSKEGKERANEGATSRERPRPWAVGLGPCNRGGAADALWLRSAHPPPPRAHEPEAQTRPPTDAPAHRRARRASASRVTHHLVSGPRASGRACQS